jgi:hypothetical protein
MGKAPNRTQLRGIVNDSPFKRGGIDRSLRFEPVTKLGA